MSRSIPYPEILKAALDGVNNSFRKYHGWSNGYWLGSAPESFIEAEIANSLSKIVPFITLQDTIRDILKNANADLRGPKPRNSSIGRMDIVVWWADETPRVLIEIKKAWKNNSLNDDAKRLRQLLNKESTLQKGVIVAYTSAKNPETIDNRFENMAYNSGTTLEDRIGPKKRKDEGEIWYWDAGCFSIDT